MKDTKEKIVFGAFRLFLEHNYEKVTVKDIEEVIGMTRGAIFFIILKTKKIYLRKLLTVLSLTPSI